MIAYGILYITKSDAARLKHSINISGIVSSISEGIVYILSRVLVTETGFELVIAFINYSHVVTTINYNTVTNFHSTSTPRQSSQSDLLFPSVLLVPTLTLVRVLLPRLLFLVNTTVTAFTSHLELSSFGTELFGSRS
jgi:hypothetical protein